MLANAPKKTQQKGLLSLKNFFGKACQQQQQLNTLFFFQKETTESWFQKQIGSFFFFSFPHLPKKRVLRSKLFWFFLLNKTKLRFGVRTKATKQKQEELVSPCFLFLSKNCFASKKATLLLTLLGKWQKQNFFLFFLSFLSKYCCFFFCSVKTKECARCEERNWKCCFFD